MGKMTGAITVRLQQMRERVILITGRHSADVPPSAARDIAARPDGRPRSRWRPQRRCSPPMHEWRRPTEIPEIATGDGRDFNSRRKS